MGKGNTNAKSVMDCIMAAQPYLPSYGTAELTEVETQEEEAGEVITPGSVPQTMKPPVNPGSVPRGH